MEPISTYYSEFSKSHLYAPGLATYGVDGKPGDKGEDGNAVYFSNLSFKANSYEVIEILNKLKNNYLLLSGTENIKNSKPYMKGDIIVTSDGEFWQIIVDPREYSEYDTLDTAFKRVCKVQPSADDLNQKIQDSSNLGENVFKYILSKSNNGRIFNLLGNGMTIGGFDEGQDRIVGESDFTLSLVGSSVASSTENFITMLNALSDEESKLSIVYNHDDGAFHVQTTKPLVIDASTIKFTESSSTGQNEYGNYSRLNILDNSTDVTFTNFNKLPMTSFCLYVKNHVSWREVKALEENVETPKSIEILFSDSDATAAICGAEHSTLEFDWKGYIKIYTANGDQMFSLSALIVDYDNNKVVLSNVKKANILAVSIIKNTEVFLKRTAPIYSQDIDID